MSAPTLQKPTPVMRALPRGQWLWMCLWLALGSILILTTVREAAAATIIVFYSVLLIGVARCRAVQCRLNDPKLGVLGYFWLVKLSLTFLVLYAGWMPQLDPATSTAWGYDPQRYYVEALELVNNNWSPDFLSINYVGILYYYAVIFHVLGHNPVIPALLNSFITLLACLYLINVCYEVTGTRERGDWRLALVLLIPEVIWFDALTSRETLVAALVILGMLTAGRYLSQSARLPLWLMLVVTGACAIAIAAIRTSMLLALVMAMALMILLVRPREGTQAASRSILMMVAGGLVALAPVLATVFGGYIFDLMATFESLTSTAQLAAGSADFTWSENSIGMLLVPQGPGQWLLFIIPRAILYVVAPLPNVPVSLHDLIAGEWSDWQAGLQAATSLGNIAALPCAMAGLIAAVRARKDNAAPLIIHLSLWVTFIAIAGGNLIIVDRYRVMATVLLYACAWFGLRADARSLIPTTFAVWFAVLIAGALGYFAYKIL